MSRLDAPYVYEFVDRVVEAGYNEKNFEENQLKQEVKCETF